MSVNWTDRLSEYLDGELRGDDAAALEARLAEDDELRAVLAELREVKDAAAARPAHAAPAGLWDGVRTRITTAETRAGASADGEREARTGLRRRLMFTLPQLAAAAGIVLLLGISLGRLTDAPTAPVGADSPTVTDARSGERTDAPDTLQPGYALFVRDLEARLDAGRDVLEPGTARVLEESLAKIDSAIVRAREALENDPNNAYLNQHLASARARKLRLLEDATTLIASQT
ncbi:MAG: hypothetical protein ACODAA_00420 [Gemmatimonadota bacterium]